MSANKPAPWIERYEELKKYKETHGDCNVPTKHGPLGIWVRNQRQDYWLLKKRKYAHVCLMIVISVDNPR